MWLGLVVYFALLALRVTLNYSSLRHYLKLPLVERVTIAKRLPAVSIIVAARNEESNLPRLLDSLNKLDYPEFDVIVVDDGSSDGTADVARRYGAHVISVEGPPAGWTGKTFACWTGAREAAAEWLLFTDAATVHGPTSLQRILSFALEKQVPGVSVFLQQRVISFWERTLLPYASQQYFIGLSPGRVNETGNRQALANGQYMLIQRQAYFRAGGHAAVRSAALDDVALATHFKSQGVLLLAARAEREASVRMYTGLADIWAGLSRNAYASIRFQGGSGVLTALGAILSALAIPCLIYGLTTASPAFELAALVTYLTATAELFLWEWLFQAPITAALWQPLAATVFLAIAVDSAIRPKHKEKGRVV